jgi:hypothetical protein
VLQHFEQTEDRSKFPVLCDCPAFGSSNIHCLNVVAVYHYLDIVDVFEMMSALQPVRKRGRPLTREKAPARDRDVEEGVNFVDPARWRKQLIRHSECLTIFAYDTRAYEKKNCTVCASPMHLLVECKTWIWSRWCWRKPSSSLYKNLWAASSCKTTACGDDDEC